MDDQSETHSQQMKDMMKKTKLSKKMLHRHNSKCNHNRPVISKDSILSKITGDPDFQKNELSR